MKGTAGTTGAADATAPPIRSSRAHVLPPSRPSCSATCPGNTARWNAVTAVTVPRPNTQSSTSGAPGSPGRPAVSSAAW